MLNLTQIWRYKDKIQCRGEVLWWIFIAGLFLFEYLLFRSYVLREISIYYPAYSDQASYLMTIYPIYQNIFGGGLGGLSFAYKMIIASKQVFLTLSNSLFFLQGLIFFVLFGVSRLGALTTNLTYFLVLQLVIALSIKNFTKSKAVAFIFLGLLLAIMTPFFGIGDLVDFRIDFVAFCLYGLLVTSIMNSQIFLERKWSIIAALVAVVIVTTREITFVYIILVIIIMLLYFLFYQRLFCKSEDEKKNVKKCTQNIIIFVFIFLTSTLPVLFLHRNHIYDYYIVGHVTGIEKTIRANMAGVSDGFLAIFYYLPHIGAHIGCCAGIILALILVSILYGLFRKKAEKNCFINFKAGLFFLFICIFVPLVILTMDMQKSPVVVGIVVLPILWFAMWVFIYILQQRDYGGAKKYIVYVLAVISMTIGIFHYLSNFQKHSSFYYENDKELTRMYEDIGNYARLAQWKSTNIALDRVNDYLHHGALIVIYYEKYGILLKAISTLGSTIFTTDAKKAMSDLKNSNVFIINLNPYPKEVTYPFNNDIERFKPMLIRYAEKSFILLNDYSFKGSKYRVYVRSATIK